MDDNDIYFFVFYYPYFIKQVIVDILEGKLRSEILHELDIKYVILYGNRKIY